MNQGIFGLAGQPIVFGAQGSTTLQLGGVTADYVPFLSGFTGERNGDGFITSGTPPATSVLYTWCPSYVVLRAQTPNFSQIVINPATLFPQSQTPGFAIEVPSINSAFVVYSPNSNRSDYTARGEPRGVGAVDIQPFRTTAAAVAAGPYSVAVGAGNAANWTNCVSVGYANFTGSFGLSGNATAVGAGNVANSASGVAIGDTNNVGGTRGVGIGTSNGASGTNAVAIGFSNSASTSNSTAVGYLNNASGLQTTALGHQNTASGLLSVAVGYTNTASGASSVALGSGSQATKGQSVVVGVDCVGAGTNSFTCGSRTSVATGLEYSFNWANGRFSVSGDQGHIRVLQRRESTDGSTAPLFSDGSSTKISLSNDTSMTFTVRVVARDTTAGTLGDTHCWTFTGGVKRNTALGTVLVGTVATLLDQSDGAAGTWTAVVAVDVVNNALVINSTGQVGKTIRWVADWEIVRNAAGL